VNDHQSTYLTTLKKNLGLNTIKKTRGSTQGYMIENFHKKKILGKSFTNFKM
jgi:hypothetical protein